MATANARTITLVVALTTLTNNILSSVLSRQLPDDPFHLARHFGWYLHVANVLSVFGLIGAIREHAPSIAIFSNYLVLDTILCSVPRFIVLGLLHTFSANLCSPSFSSSYYPVQGASTELHAQSISHISPRNAISYISARSNSGSDLPSITPSAPGQWDSFSNAWSNEGCENIVMLAQWTLVAGVVAGTLLQFVGAVYVREYARNLWIRERREEERFLRAKRLFVTEFAGGNSPGRLAFDNRLDDLDEEEYLDYGEKM